MRDDDKLWDTIHLFAADLIIYHSITDKNGRKKHPISNELEKTMHHITNSHAGIDDVLNWLNIRMMYANYFERTKQTILQLAIIHEVISKLKGFIDDTELAPSLGWIAQLMSYYAEYPSDARQRLGRMSSLFEAVPPEIVAVTIPNIVKKKAMLRPQTAESQQKAVETLSAFEEIWAKRAEKDADNKLNLSRQEKRKEKRKRE